MSKNRNSGGTLRIGVIGAGWIANLSHGPALAEYAKLHPQVVLGAVCDLDPKRAGEFASRFGFGRAYGSVEEMLGTERLDAVYVLVPDRLIAGVAEGVLLRGLPVLIEKPPGKTPGEVARLLQTASRTGTPHFVAFNRRCMPLMAELKRRVLLAQEESGGGPEMISYLFSRHGRNDSDFSTTAIHPVDAVSFLGGSPYLELKIDYHKEEGGAPRGANIFLHGGLRSGTRVSISITPDGGMNCERVDIAFPGRGFSLSVPCVKGADGEGLLREYRQGALVSEVDGRTVPTNRNDGFYRETEMFLDGLLAGQRRFAGHDLASALQSVSIMHAIETRATAYVDEAASAEGAVASLLCGMAGH